MTIATAVTLLVAGILESVGYAIVREEDRGQRVHFRCDVCNNVWDTTRPQCSDQRVDEAELFESFAFAQFRRGSDDCGSANDEVASGGSEDRGACCFSPVA